MAKRMKRKTKPKPPAKRGRPKKTDKKKDAYNKEFKDPKTGKFLKGKCPNPKGRPKGSVSLRTELNNLLRELCPEGDAKSKKIWARALMETLAKLALAGDTKALQLAMEHNSGKPIQAVVDMTPGNRLEGVSDDKLRRLMNGSGKKTPKIAEDDEDEESEDDEDDG